MLLLSLSHRLLHSKAHKSRRSHYIISRNANAIFFNGEFSGVEYLRGQTIVRTNGCRASEKVCHRRKSCSRFCSSRDLCMAGIFVRISLICLSSFEATVLVGRRGSVPIFVRNPFSSDAHRFFSLQTDASLLLRERACVAPVAGEGRHSWTTMVTLNPTTNLHYCRRSCVFAHFRFVAFAFVRSFTCLRLRLDATS